jgi:GntR family transcriptional regulator
VPRKLADTLSIRPNVPLLYIERVTFSEQGTPVEFLRFYHRGDRYSLYNELSYWHFGLNSRPFTG